MTKKELLQHADPGEITAIIVNRWSGLHDDERREYCLEEIYASLADAVVPNNFDLLSDDAKAQLELDVDMLLITIEWDDIGRLIFDDDANEAYFWSLIGDKDDKKNQKIFTALFG